MACWPHLSKYMGSIQNLLPKFGQQPQLNSEFSSSGNIYIMTLPLWPIWNNEDIIVTNILAFFTYCRILNSDIIRCWEIIWFSIYEEIRSLSPFLWDHPVSQQYWGLEYSKELRVAAGCVYSVVYLFLLSCLVSWGTTVLEYWWATKRLRDCKLSATLDFKTFLSLSLEGW